MKRLPLVASFLLFIALCASAAYWGMQLFKPPLRPVAAPPRVAQAEIRTEPAAALFGGKRANAAVASNYQLKGIIFSGSPRDSVAIISADGKPPQAVRVNAELMPGVTVKEVHRGYVLLSEDGATKRVELPEDSKVQGSMGVAPSQPSLPIANGQRLPISPRTQAMPPSTPPVTSAPPPPAPVVAQPQVPVPGQIPSTVAGQVPGVAAGQVPGQIPGQIPGQATVQPSTQPSPAITPPPTVVVSPPPGGQAGAAPQAVVPGTPQPGIAAPVNPQIPVAPGTQQPIPGAPVAR